MTIDDTRLLKQWQSVLRFTPGTALELFDGFHGAEYVIIELGKKSAQLHKKGDYMTLTPEQETWLFFAPLKRDNTELVIQKAVELGVTHLTPIISERTVVRDVNHDRLQKIIIEAAEQSGRTDMPLLYPPRKLTDIEFNGQLYAADRSFTQPAEPTKATRRGLIIGPEGGWTNSERVWLSENAIGLNLGRLTLRAETAAIVGLYEVMRG